MTVVRLSVRGRVQGVGYRWFTRHAAEERGVTGWVRNRRDGTVEAELHGSEEAVDAVIAAMRIGPAQGRVDETRILSEEIVGAEPNGFEILPTV